ncbi:MAG: (deoxy)nucleoside triphosphate pyrophosphohydrolase [Lentisphaeria bacterium]|nr:(deoxy)nucleoside triphosphate pyrophosphohydrolase [Lentisphaeria bacterium]
MMEVTAAVILEGNRVLVCQRLNGKWEFPGGKLEADENLEACLIREIKEELSLSIKIQAFLQCIDYPIDTGTLRLSVFQCTILTGEICLRVHQAFQWLTLDELAGVDLMAADRLLELNKLNFRL